MTKPSLRSQILDAGLKVMFRQGYIGSGVRDIVAEAQAPQGSSPTTFGRKKSSRARFLTATSSARWASSPKRLTTRACRRASGCGAISTLSRCGLPPTASPWLSDRRFQPRAIPHSEMLRSRLVEIFAQWRALRGLHRRGASRRRNRHNLLGRRSRRIPPRLLGGRNPAYEGERSAAPLERFKTIAFDTVFKEL